MKRKMDEKKKINLVNSQFLIPPGGETAREEIARSFCLIFLFKKKITQRFLTIGG